MSGKPTPFVLFQTQLEALRTELAAALDGDVESVHRARVATRRIRELLPLTTEWRRRAGEDDLHARFKELGRSLGRVRDADVQIETIARLEEHIPHSAKALVIVRQHQERRRQKLLRRWIKRSERLDVPRLLKILAHPPRMARLIRGHPLANLTRPWRHRLRHTLAVRAKGVEDAIAHATKVYFPKRAHGTRIAIKKLRYAKEIADHTGVREDPEALRVLKKAQEILGDIHDRQTFVDEAATHDFAHDSDDLGDQIAIVTQLLEAECHELYERYLTRRDAVLAICAEERHALSDRSMIGLPLFAAVTLSSVGVYALHRAAVGAGAEDEDADRV